MKTFTNILLLAVFTAGVFNCAEAQRNRGSIGGNGSSSRSGERREMNTSVQRGNDRPGRPGGSEMRVDRGNFGNRPSSPSVNRQPADRQIVANRGGGVRNSQVRNDVARLGERDNRITTDRANRGPGQYNRGNTVYTNRYNNNRSYNSRYSSNRYSNNNYSYNNNRYNNRYYRTGYYPGGYSRGFGFAYGPRYSIIPRNHISIYFGGNPYYFYNGYYYGYYGGYYEPIFPPLGLRINILPLGYSSLFIGGYPYYYYNGIYYRQYDNSDYEVVDPPMGASVYSLPKGAKSVLLNGEKMYELNGTYYKEDRSSRGEVMYTVVGKNGEINNTGDNGAMENSVPPANNDVAAPPASLQMGDIVTQLPEGSRVVTINGEKLYVAPDDTYLKEDAEGGAVKYKVVGIAK
ncbi:MAG: DUF6515 family protein [Ginsengibacter sp.]